MTTKPTFVDRNINKQSRSTAVDAIQIINYYLSLHPANKVRVGSPLYNAAVKQYNANIKNTLVRPTVPDWFCGKVKSDTNELINPPTDEELRVSAGFVSDVPLPITPVPRTIPTNYIVDKCLNIGTPGSAPYARCTLIAAVDENNAVSGIDWTGSMQAEEALVLEGAEEAVEETKAEQQVTNHPTHFLGFIWSFFTRGGIDIF